jgi:hypothetical protein
VGKYTIAHGAFVARPLKGAPQSQSISFEYEQGFQDVDDRPLQGSAWLPEKVRTVPITEASAFLYALLHMYV